MWATALPPGDPDHLRRELRRRGIEVPVAECGGLRLVRVSIASYNEWRHVERLVRELELQS